MPHLRERTLESRNKLIAIRLTMSELESLDDLLNADESRTEFVVNAIDAYKINRVKRLKNKPVNESPRAPRIKRHLPYKTIEEVFFKNLSDADGNGCILYKSLGSDGYGQVSFKGKHTKAHRFAYELYQGIKIPKDKIIMHICDNKACVAKDHLMLGTSRENTHDMLKKSRHGTNVKLSKEKVKEIKSKLLSGTTRKQLAKEYNVSKATIDFIAANRTWKHV